MPAQGPLYQTHFRRRHAGKTDYSKRLALLKSRKPRLVVRKTNKYVIAQVVAFSPNGDRVVASATSKNLRAYGFSGKCNTPSAYLTGFLVAKKAAKAGVADFVLDIGLHAPTKGGVVFACCRGALDAGLRTALDEKILPSQERISGKHLNLNGAFEQTKQKIIQEVS